MALSSANRWPETKDSRDEQQGFNTYGVQKKLGATTESLRGYFYMTGYVGGHPMDVFLDDCLSREA